MEANTQVPQVRLGPMTHVEPSFVLYALLRDPGCCLRAHTVLIEPVEPVEPEREKNGGQYQGIEAMHPTTRTPAPHDRTRAP